LFDSNKKSNYDSIKPTKQSEQSFFPAEHEVHKDKQEEREDSIANSDDGNETELLLRAPNWLKLSKEKHCNCRKDRTEQRLLHKIARENIPEIKVDEGSAAVEEENSIEKRHKNEKKCYQIFSPLKRCLERKWNILCRDEAKKWKEGWEHDTTEKRQGE
jgi:hypothetical protein